MFSIDQNCHSLWDALPKLQAVARSGGNVRHFIEDIDVAFTAVGASPVDSAGHGDGSLRLAMERYYGSGGADWGAALFYSEFLGRLPVDVRQWESLTGLTTAALARRLGGTVNDLYDRYSPGDTWQLIGPSYVGDHYHHRLIGDLTVAEITDRLAEMMHIAEADLLARFPAADSQQRVRDWMQTERGRIDGLVAQHRDGRVVDMYRDWLGAYVDNDPAVTLDITSNLFAVGADPAETKLLNVFVRHYDRAADLYNQAMADSHSGPLPLATANGELPFFAAVDVDGRLARTEVFLDGDELRIGEHRFQLVDGGLPIHDLREAGVSCLTGKAPLLVLQARVAGGGTGLVVPYRGSSYMPAVHALHRRLADGGLLPEPIGPLLRVRFRLLDRMEAVDTPIALPAHLAIAFGRSELPAREFAGNWHNVSAEAAARLAKLETEDGRLQWQRIAFAHMFDEIDDLSRRRRDLATIDAKSPEIRELSHRTRQLETEVITHTLEQIAVDWQAANMDYWDSRGAILPWCVALGGEAFYDSVIAQAELYEESPEG